MNQEQQLAALEAQLAAQTAEFERLMQELRDMPEDTKLTVSKADMAEFEEMAEILRSRSAPELSAPPQAANYLRG